MQPDPEHPTLTPREYEVLDLFGNGHNRNEIAELLGITPAMVSAHATHAYTKLGAFSIPHGVRILTLIRQAQMVERVQQTPVSEQRLHI